MRYQFCAELNPNRDGANPVRDKGANAHGDTNSSIILKRFIYHQEVSVCVKVRIEPRQLIHGRKLATSHACRRYDCEISLTRDDQTRKLIKGLEKTDSRSGRAVFKFDKSRVISSNREDELSKKLQFSKYQQHRRHRKDHLSTSTPKFRTSQKCCFSDCSPARISAKFSSSVRMNPLTRRITFLN